MCVCVRQLWLYDQGEVTHVGVGHSASITRVAITPLQKMIVSYSVDGAIFVWPTLPPAPVDIMAAAERHEDEDDRCLDSNYDDDDNNNNNNKSSSSTGCRRC